MYIVSNGFLGNVCLSLLVTGIVLLTLQKAVSICILKFNFSSRYIPKCLWCEVLSTEISLKNISGWPESPFFLEKITSCASFVGFRLKRIFYVNAHFEINDRSWERSFALSFLFLTMLKIDVLSPNSFTLLFKPSGMLLITCRQACYWYINIEPWAMTARIGLYDQGFPFKTTV